MSPEKLFAHIQKNVLDAQIGLGKNKVPPSQKRLFKEYSQVLQCNIEQVSLTQCTSVLYLLFRLGMIKECSEFGQNKKLVALINQRLLTIFNQSQSENQALKIADLLFRTPNLPLHHQLVKKITNCSTRYTPKFHLKFLGFWQRELKAARAASVSIDEQRSFRVTKAYVKVIFRSDLIDLIAQQPTLREKVHLAPVLTKYHSDVKYPGALQASLMQELLRFSGKQLCVSHSFVDDLTYAIFFFIGAGLPIEQKLSQLFSSHAALINFSLLRKSEFLKFTAVYLHQMREGPFDKLVQAHIRRM